MRARVTLAAIAFFVLTAADAEASPSARLIYVRGSGAEACPAEADLRAAVAVRLGYDPFFPTAQKSVVAQISRVPKGYRARVQIVTDDGNLRGERELSTKGDDCRELTSAIALAVSLALDDLDEAVPSPPPDPPARILEITPAAEPPPPARDAPPMTRSAAGSSHMELATSVGPTLSIGTAPNAAAGASLALAFRWPRVAVQLDAHGELPASKAISTGGRVDTNVAFATGSVCVRFGLPFLCAGGGAGAVWSRTKDIARPATDRGTLIVTSLRLGVEVATGSRIFLQPFVEFGANLLHPTIEVSGWSVYEMSPVWGAVGTQIGAQIF